MTFDLCPETGAPISRRLTIRPEMIDYNGHLNVAAYVKLFDEAIDQFFAAYGLADTYVREQRKGFFSVEMKVRYLRELMITDPVQVRTRMVEVDDKRILYWSELIHADDRWLSATLEGLTLHMDMAARRVAPFPPEVRAKFEAWRDLTAGRPRPEAAGHPVAIRSRKGV